MNILLAFSFSIFLVSFSSNAQMASASIFPEMKALNPAVISLRPNRTLAMYGKIDKSDKTQDLSKNFGAGGESVESGEIISYNGFYGGKGGGLFTMEVLTDIATAEKTFELSLPSSSTSSSSSEASGDFQFIGVGIGIGDHFGISISKLNLDTTSKDNATVTFGGTTTTINTESSSELDYLRMRAGARFSLGLDFGFYFESTSEEEKTQTNASYAGAAPGNSSETKTAIGLGLGMSTKKLRWEVFYEKKLDDDVVQSVDGNISYSPVRYGGTLEFVFGKLKLGYTGMFYVDGFVDLEKEVYDAIIYGSSATESRLENTINFSFGSGDKGHVFGGGAFYSKTDTLEITAVDRNNKYPTTTTVKGASIKYGYAF